MDAPQYKSIEYQFRDQRLYEDYYALFSIGWEYWASPEVYYRDCRTSAYKQCVFQYTVSGEGTLVYNQKAYAIKPGQAFLIERPGQYQYYRRDAGSKARTRSVLQQRGADQAGDR